RFRGADVTVFHETREYIKSDGGREIRMDTCFRTHDRLVGFVNHIFPKVLTGESKYDTPYEPMSAMRQPASAAVSVELHIITRSAGSEDRLSAGELREAEAKIIASRINEIIDRGDPLVCDEDGKSRPAHPGDFALLFQAATSFET